MADPKDEEFRLFCVEQVERLGVFERFQFMNTAGKKEFRKFFESHTRDRQKVEAVMDEAVKLSVIPTLADMRGIWSGLFPLPDLGPVLTDEEKQKRAEYWRDWYSREVEEAKQRRKEFLAKLPLNRIVVTDADIESIRLRQEQNRERIALAAESLNQGTEQL